MDPQYLFHALNGRRLEAQERTEQARRRRERATARAPLRRPDRDPVQRETCPPPTSPPAVAPRPHRQAC